MELVKDNILPRLTQLEEDVRMLREVTWPVCQGLREKHGVFQFLKEKRMFFSTLFKEEAVKLLRLKSDFLGITDQVILDQELNSICVHRIHSDGSVSV